MYTSGTTGAPKGAVLGGYGIACCFALQAERTPTRHMRTVANLPSNHVAGLGDLRCTPLTVGGTIVFQEDFDPDAMLDAIERQGVSSLMQVPTTLKVITEHPRWDRVDLSGLEYVGWGGAALPLPVLRRFVERGITPLATYGMTEVTCSITYTDLGASEEVLVNTVGRPIPECSIKLIDDQGQIVPAEGVGELLVRHPRSAAGVL